VSTICALNPFLRNRNLYRKSTRDSRIVDSMEPKNQITAAVFSAFVKCPTKAYLLAMGDPPRDTYYSAMVEGISATYKSVAKRQLLSGRGGDELCNFAELWSDRKSEAATCYVDCETAVYDLARTDRIGDHNSKLFNTTIPVLFVPWEKLEECHNLLVSFGALALSQRCGTAPNDGAIFYGDSYRRKTVKIANHVARTRQTIDAIGAALREQKPPTLILNHHCVVCDFQQRCRRIATERDDLSLLTSMTVKDRAKCAAKGISRSRSSHIATAPDDVSETDRTQSVPRNLLGACPKSAQIDVIS
jgi:predicted RecB family nuclease